MEKLRVYLIWQSVSNWVILIYYVAHFLCAHITFTAVQLIVWLLHSCVGILLFFAVNQRINKADFFTAWVW